MIERLLPPDVAAVARPDDVPLSSLFEAELAAIRDAVPRRRSEYATVRWAARSCLAQLGHPPVPILSGAGGAPRWPAGHVGAMTHCQGYRAAAVARVSTADGLGIDAEPAQPLPDRVLPEISSADEREHVTDLGRRWPLAPWDRLLFSAKESYYKVWFPAMGCWLGFDDVEVRFETPDDPARGDFTVRPCSGGPRRGRRDADFDAAATGFPALQGRWGLAVDADGPTGRTGDAVVVTTIVAPVGAMSGVRSPQTGRTRTGMLR
ncbi:MAG: 4'-phosphopantetheinyl transferase superfamily protein [Nocardioides sp.]|nr:4'-phosphopantetheinyl transferase superfamily protein [Nocardioides sp.]